MEGLAGMQTLTMEFFSSRSPAWTLVTSLCAIALLGIFRKRRNALPFPPGPKALPLVGNIWDLPNKNAWLTYSHWGKKYGKYFPQLNRERRLQLWNEIDSDIVHAKFLGTHVIILNSAKAAHELFEKRSSI